MDRREFNKIITSILTGSFISVNLANADEKDQIYSINIQTTWSIDKLWDDFEYKPKIEVTLETNIGTIKSSGEESKWKIIETPSSKNLSTPINDLNYQGKDTYPISFRINDNLKLKDLKINNRYTFELIVKTP